MSERLGRRAAPALLALVAAAACGTDRDASAPPPEPRLTTLAELQIAVQRNLQRGALVSFWATW